MPRLLLPMMAVTGELPTGRDAEQWALELKWDGVRAISYIDGGRVRATSRRGNDITGRYPELGKLGEVLGSRRAVLDGEVVAFDAEGRPSFAALQRRMHVADPAARGLLREVPVTYVVFDVLYLDGTGTTREPYRERRALLEELPLNAPPVQCPPYFAGDGAELLDATREQGLEGLIAKRFDSRYLPGRRVDFWRKVKNFATQSVVVGGWQPGRGRRGGGIGSLLLGVNDEQGLRFAGHVGTGFTERALDDLAKVLRPLRVPRSPFVDEVPREHAKEARWVEPRIVGEVAFTAWTKDNRLRNPSWRGLREDQQPEEVTRESP